MPQFNLLRFSGWSPEDDAQWLVLNVVLMLLLSGAGYLQWFVLFHGSGRLFDPGGSDRVL